MTRDRRSDVLSFRGMTPKERNAEKVRLMQKRLDPEELKYWLGCITSAARADGQANRRAEGRSPNGIKPGHGAGAGFSLRDMNKAIPAPWFVSCEQVRGYHVNGGYTNYQATNPQTKQIVGPFVTSPELVHALVEIGIDMRDTLGMNRLPDVL